MNPTCKYCGFTILETNYFCPNCGKKLKEPSLSKTIGKQIYIYALSILLPPLGLWPGIKYLLQKDQKAKIIGLIAIILTIVSAVITIKITLDLLNSQLGNASLNSSELQDLGL